jgi:hypothetical protein
MILWISSLQAIKKSPVLIQAICRHHPHLCHQASYVHVFSCITQYRPGFSGVILFDSGSACGGEWCDECVCLSPDITKKWGCVFFGLWGIHHLCLQLVYAFCTCVRSELRFLSHILWWLPLSGTALLTTQHPHCEVWR